MASTAQNHMEPLKSEGKKDEDREEERELGWRQERAWGPRLEGHL